MSGAHAAGDPCRIITPGVKRIEVVAGILWRGGRFLAACRPEGSVHAGQWEFPGGKVEAGEDAEAALARELREELGVELGMEAGRAQFWRTLEHVYTTPPRHVVLHFFHVRDFAGQACAREGQELRWLTPVEAAELPFLEADVPVVRDLAHLVGVTV